MEVPINYLAVLVCAVANTAIGFAWYGPLFGKVWSEMMGWRPMTPEKQADMQKKAMPGYAISFIGALVMAWVLANAISLWSILANNTDQLLSTGLVFAFFGWVGFIAPVTAGVVLWDGKPWKLWFINAGYYLVALLVMGMILALWR